MNPQKVQAIFDMKSLTTLNEVPGLTGRLVALSRFIFRATDLSFPFFQAIKKGKDMKWTCCIGKRG